jgi:Methyltransferase domain
MAALANLAEQLIELRKLQKRDDLTQNRFRARRGRVLRSQIASLAEHFGRPIVILDVGGRADYWGNVGVDNVAAIHLLNDDERELDLKGFPGLFIPEFGDARNLPNYADKSVDLVHSNSVIEHVGHWQDMCAMTDEVLRVGLSGWIQTPAWEFPIEPHFRLPFLHWFAQPLRRMMLRASRDYGAMNIRDRRYHADRINLLSYGEFKSLFPGCELFVERLVVAKSYTARWAPAGVVLSR